MCSLSISSSNPGLPAALKKSILMTVLFVGLFFGFDQTIYSILNAGFQRTTSGEAGGSVNKVLKEKIDMVILGSSRAVLQYDPRILGAKLNMAAYNAGCNGQNLHYARGIVDLVLKRQTPSIAIMDIDAGSVQDAAVDLNKATVLAPFMGDSGVIKNMLYSKGVFERLKYLSRSFRFNSKVLSILKNLFLEDTSMDGFTPNTTIMDPEQYPDIMQGDMEPEPAMMQLLRETISALKAAGTHVVLVVSPRWTKEGKVPSYRMPALRAIRELAQREQVSFLAVTIESASVFQKSEYYKDPAHLNAEGARIFSEILAAKLASLMENQFAPVCDVL